MATPLPLNCKLSSEEGMALLDPTLYRTLIGKLNFLPHTRPDLSFTGQTLILFIQAPKDTHFQALQHTFRYVNGTTRQGIFLTGSDQLQVHAYLDSNWASYPFTRRSVSSYIILLGSSPIS